jgi:hypothetical protein
MTCQGVLVRNRTVDGKLTCQLNGMFLQTTAGPAVPDRTKLPSCQCPTINGATSPGRDSSRCSFLAPNRNCTIDCASGLVRLRSPAGAQYTCGEDGQFRQLSVDRTKFNIAGMPRDE